MRGEIFAPDNYYHVYSRVIFNRPEFRDKVNSEKLALNFWVANSTESDKVFLYLRNNKKFSRDDKTIEDILKKGERLVDILCYCIMPDHYHLLLKERKKGGIRAFIHKCNTSVAKYINLRNDRKGPLFERRFQAKLVDDNRYLLHLSLYIHLNPLDFIDNRSWREHGLTNWGAKKNKLLKYPWFSLKFFVDKEYEDRILSGTEIITEQFKNSRDYENFLQEWSVESKPVFD